MEHISVTALRTNIYKLVDRVLATGEPLVIDKNGRQLVLAPQEYYAALESPDSGVEEDIFARLEPHPGTIIGDLEEGASVWDEQAWLMKWDERLKNTEI